MNPYEFNFVLGPVCNATASSMLDGEPYKQIPINSTVTDLVVLVGLFPSKNQARKNGYVGEIGEGIHCFEFGKGKNKKIIYTYKPPSKYFKVKERFERRYAP